MIRFNLLIPIAIFLLTGYAKEQNISDWRGPNRDGIYHETGLLKEWPEDGPEMLWSFEGLGYGHSAVAVANDKVYVNGIKDTLESMGTLFTFDLAGNLLWEKEFGKDFSLNFHGTRSTPVVVNDLIYIESGMGAVYCLKAKNGEEVWSKDFIEDFGTDSVIQFGYSESVLIDGDDLVCVPGAQENNVVALNRFNGELVWASAGEGEPATYNSPIMINHNGQKLVIATTANSIMGIDANTGEKYWRVEHTQQNKIHANTPVYAGGKLVVASADRTKTSGMVQLQLSEDGKEVVETWRNLKVRNFMGGVIKIDTCLYGSSYMRKNWEVINWNTGESLVQNKELGGGAIIYADGLFYCYAERDGEVALVDASPEKFEIISRFKVPMGTKEHWAHPVIDNGVLYVRHGDALMAYDVKEQ
ncbi:MAG: PQQ-binding-like beta-propeller repeat protein [Bacteroidota bacterium]